ncbi:Carboxylesterase protein [Rutstroemia sp. NJR-2017a BVV2]|nr:Carboxylesterase protein [Rutstroemia sp. NJR-2017a BVV2]
MQIPIKSPSGENRPVHRVSVFICILMMDGMTIYSTRQSWNLVVQPEQHLLALIINYYSRDHVTDIRIDRNPLAYYTVPAENLTRTAGCWTSSDKLACLRNLTSDQLYKAQVSQQWNPIVDGDFLTDYPSSLAPQGKFIKVPLLIGANSDEGSSFGITGLDNETAIFNSLLWYRASNAYALSPPTARKLLELYPNDPANEPPYYINNPTIFPSKGLQWRRDAAIAGDLVMIAGRRKMCEQYTNASQTVYSYRCKYQSSHLLGPPLISNYLSVDTPLWNGAITDGARHCKPTPSPPLLSHQLTPPPPVVNVVFSFQNISGALGPLPKYNNYLSLSRAIGRSYISFVNHLDPNTLMGNITVGNTTVPTWPKYELGAPKNVVWNSNMSWVESDTWRKEGIDFINYGGVDRELWS